MTDFFALLIKGWTPGATGIWLLVVMALIAWWQGLPKLLDALANRQSKVEERMGALLRDATERFEREIAAADKRHEDCMEGQDRLFERIRVLEACVTEQQDTISGLKRQLVQMQVSAVRVEGSPVPSVIEGMMRQLEDVPEIKLERKQ